MTHFIIAYHISLVSVQTNYCNNNYVNQLNKIMKLYYLKALLVSQDKIKIYYGMSRVKKQPSGKRSVKLKIATPSKMITLFSLRMLEDCRSHLLHLLCQCIFEDFDQA